MAYLFLSRVILIIEHKNLPFPIKIAIQRPREENIKLVNSVDLKWKMAITKGKKSGKINNHVYFGDELYIQYFVSSFRRSLLRI